MLTVYIGTFCRPDLVDLVSRAAKATCQEECRVIVQLQPGALTRGWPAVDGIIHASSRRWPWMEIDRAGHASVFLDDDCVPLLPWSSASFPAPHSRRKDGGTTIVFSDGTASHYLPKPKIDVARIGGGFPCPASWGDICTPSERLLVESLLGGVFLHLDKSSAAHPNSPLNQGKREIVELIAKRLGFPAPDKLSEKELAFQPGGKLAAWPSRSETGSPRDPRPGVSALQKAANFATSAAKHLAAGAPRCTQEQIDARFAICQQCEHFDGKACGKCGCPVVRERQFLSKLSWAGEKCPAGKWGPVDGIATVESEGTPYADAGPPLPPQR